MHAHHTGMPHWNSESPIVHTFRHISMWTIPLLMSLVCLAWGVSTLLLGRFDGPDMISWGDAALMSAAGFACFCYVLVGDYLRSHSRPLTSIDHRQNEM